MNTRLLHWVARVLTVTLLAPSVGPVLAQTGTCTRLSEVCVEGPATKVISGYPVTRDCWRFQAEHNCRTAALQSDCGPLSADPACGPVGTNCVDTDANGQCVLFEVRYQCALPGPTRTVLDCGGRTFCLDGKCLDTSYPPDTDFARVISGMELAREAGTYFDVNTSTLFRGEGASCSHKLFGLSNCCKGNAGGGKDFSNQGLVAQAGWAVGKQVLDVGSYYVYDTLYSNFGNGFATKGLGAALGILGADGAFNPTLGFYGFNVAFNAQATGVALGSVSTSAGTFTFAFDPWSFAIAVVITIIIDMMECSEDEQKTALKRGQNLCHFVGSYCASKALNACVTKKEGHCCFNSRLARIINEQGRAQIGKGWGSGESPDCSGFTLAQIEALDFAAMDLAEFFGEIQAKALSEAQVSAQNSTLLNQKVQDYFTSSPRLPAYEAVTPWQPPGR